MRRKLSLLCMLFVLLVCNTAAVRAAEYKATEENPAAVEQMCPEEIALRQKLEAKARTRAKVPAKASLAAKAKAKSSIFTATGLTISKTGDAGCGSSVTGGTDVKSIEIFMYLLTNDTHDTVDSWMDVKTGTYFDMARHHQLTKRGTYIVKASIYVLYDDDSYKNLVRYSHTDTY